MKIRINADGRVLQGTPKQIVEAMQSIAFGQDARTLGEYSDWAAETASRMMGVDLKVSGETDEEKAASLVRAMIDAGLATKM